VHSIWKDEEQRIDHLKRQVERRFHIAYRAVKVVRAPLRICPLGAHIDHQLGQVTGMTIDRSLLLAFAPTDDNQIIVESANFDAPTKFSLNAIPAYQAGDWGNYVRGAVLALQESYELQRGFVGILDGEMPVGGLSSSAAATIAYLLALENITIKQVAGPTSPDSFGILVVYSGVQSSSLEGTGYNNRVAECQEAARLLLEYASQSLENSKEARLRDVSPEIFETEGHRLPQMLHRRAKHYFDEMARVERGLAAWVAGDMNLFGECISASGASSIHQYECGCPQMITLYEILSETSGVYGTRFSGAGFRGNSIAIIDPAKREGIAEAVQRAYPDAHPEITDVYSVHYCHSGGPAQII